MLFDDSQENEHIVPGLDKNQYNRRKIKNELENNHKIG